MTRLRSAVIPRQGTASGVRPTIFFRPAAFFVATACALETFADVDLWGHVQFGFDILDSGRVKSFVDPYSFTQDRPFLYHEWLGGVAMAVAYRLGGDLGLRLLKVVLLSTLLALVWRSVRHAPFAWRWSGMMLAAVGALPIL